jgi:hypothetical protein
MVENKEQKYEKAEHPVDEIESNQSVEKTIVESNVDTRSNVIW